MLTNSNQCCPHPQNFHFKLEANNWNPLKAKISSFHIFRVWFFVWLKVRNISNNKAYAKLILNVITLLLLSFLGPFIEEFFQCVTFGSYSAPWQEKFYTMFTLLFMFIIPLLILVFSYLSTFRTISSKY